MKLNIKKITKEEILTRDQLKGILGGHMGSGAVACSLQCTDINQTVISYDCGFDGSCDVDYKSIYCNGIQVVKCPT